MVNVHFYLRNVSFLNPFCSNNLLSLPFLPYSLYSSFSSICCQYIWLHCRNAQQSIIQYGNPIVVPFYSVLKCVPIILYLGNRTHWPVYEWVWLTYSNNVFQTRLRFISTFLALFFFQISIHPFIVCAEQCIHCTNLNHNSHS